MTLDLKRRQVRAKVKFRSDGLKDVPAGCKSFVREFWIFRDLILFTVLTTARLLHQISVGGSGLL
jgi:hypothetical protein